MYADIHSHLGASCSAHFMWEMAHRQGIKLDHKDYWKFLQDFNTPPNIDHEKYLQKFPLTQKIQSSPDAVGQSMFEAFSNNYRNSKVTYLEIRLNPLLRNKEGLYDVDFMILKACTALKKVKLAYPIDGGIILETDRKFSSKKSEIIAKKAVEFKEMGIVGFDMSGSYYKDPTFDFAPHAKAFDIAKKGGLGITVHAGELPGTQQEIWDAIKYCQADRIGHGIQIEDKGLIQILREDNICLELCPTGNITTGVIPDWPTYLKKVIMLHEAGVPLTLNSDGAEFLQSYVKDEFEKLIELSHEIEIYDMFETIRENGFKYGFKQTDK